MSVKGSHQREQKTLPTFPQGKSDLHLRISALPHRVCILSVF
jgi:hypothetical protein